MRIDSSEARARTAAWHGACFAMGMIGALGLSQAVVDAWRGEIVRLAGADLRVPGTRRIRLSVVAGNLRMHRLLDRFVRPGATVVDVGANIGYNAIHAARLAGPRGRVFAVEPTPDNLDVLRRNLAAAALANVVVAPVAAGRAAGMRKLFVRGARSAVNSLFADSCYAAVTDVFEVPVVPLDELVAGTADVVKIDVEGAELDVLEGMPRLLNAGPGALIVEWHPKLQSMAGYAPDELPRWLLGRGWRLRAVSHTTGRTLTAASLQRLTARLLRLQRPVELLATPPL
jgi:FkbM family methyltransferase